MVKISILYPNTPGSRFDVEYYVNKHMPRAIELQGDIPNYTDVSALIQVNEVLLAR